MSDDTNEDGGGPDELQEQPEQGLTAADQAAMKEAFDMFTGVMLSQTLGVLQVFAPHLQPDVAMQLAQSCVSEQVGPITTEIIPSLIVSDAVAKYPTLIVRIGRQGAEIKVDVKAAKRLDRVNDPGAAAQTGLLLALLLSPAARAVLKAFGWHYHFMASPENLAGGIILQS